MSAWISYFSLFSSHRHRRHLQNTLYLFFLSPQIKTGCGIQTHLLGFLLWKHWLNLELPVFLKVFGGLKRGSGTSFLSPGDSLLVNWFTLCTMTWPFTQPSDHHLLAARAGNTLSFSFKHANTGCELWHYDGPAVRRITHMIRRNGSV